jgi:hypothetical protein
MMGMVMVDSRFRFGVTSVDVDLPTDMFSKIGGPVTNAGDIVFSPAALNALGDVSGNIQYDWRNGGIFSIRLVGNTTITAFLNPLSWMVPYRIHVTQDGTGSRTLTLPAGVVYPGPTAPNPAINLTANQLTVIELVWIGSANYIARMDRTGIV